MRNPCAVFVSTLLLVVGGGVGFTGVPSPPVGDAEPSGVTASSEVQANLAGVPHLIEIGRFKEALAASDDALEFAQQADDRPGVALAQSSRAGALLRLKRFEEAAAAWREATAIWRGRGDRTRELEALATTGIALLARDPKSAEGHELIEGALTLAQEREAKDPLGTAHALQDAGEIAFVAQQRDSAIRLFSAAVAMAERHSPESEVLIGGLVGLGKSQVGQGGDPVLARETLARALAVARRVAPGGKLGAECLTWLGEVEKGNQNFPAALDLLRQSLAILDVIDPKGYATSSDLIDVGVCEAYLGRLDDARDHTLRALSIREAVAAHPTEITACLGNLGIIELFAGNLGEAEAYLERAAGIEEELGDDAVGLAQTLINLGAVSMERWRFDAARQHFEKALALLEEHAPTHDARGKALGNLREMSQRQGDYDAAESYSKREIAFFDQYYPDSVELGVALTGAGNIALERGDPVAAKAYHARALDIRERKTPGSDLVSESMLYLGESYLELDDLDEAEAHLLRGLEVVGGGSATGQDAAQIVSSLGKVAYRRGDFEQAERQQRRAIRLWEGLGRHGDPNVAGPLLWLAEALEGLGRDAEAFDAALQSESLRLTYLQTSSRTLTEREALAYGSTHQEGLDLALTLASETGNGIPKAQLRAFDAVIRSRAVVLDEIAARNRQLWTTADPGVARLADDYAVAGDKLARLVVQGPEEGDSGEYSKAVDEARVVKDRAERALAAASGEFRRDLAREQAGFDEVAGRMASAGTLVAYVRYERIAPPASQPRPVSASTEETFEYAAFVLPQGSREPLMVSLGSAPEIDALVAELRQQISATLAAGALAGKRATDQYRAVGTRLREQVWDPVAQQLGDASRVFVVPDGALNLVELAALPVGDSQYLVETGPRIHYLSAERDVLGYEAAPGGGGLLALGDPAFDEPSLFAALVPEGAAVKLDETYRVASADTYRGLRSSCGGFSSMHFEPLPATGDEVNEVVGLWRKQARHPPEQARTDEVTSLRGASASEAAFKNLASGARMIHLATHGFFLGEGCPSAMDQPSARSSSGVTPSAIAGESPLLLAGFALAGANHRNAAGPDEEDGILTAEEIASLNLTNLDWAVLSACDTGVGEVRVGEGVFGLRRAFQVAGARTLIMSLWPVEDETTRQWMKALYSNRFARGMSTIDAVHEANVEVLRLRREAGLSTHPAYWAGFIASGDWQ